MNSRTTHPTLSDTNPSIRGLQAELLKQFVKLRPDDIPREYLGHFLPVGTATKQPFGSELSESQESPMLRIVAEEQKQRAVALQKWEGMVTDFDGIAITARLKDLGEGTPEEEIELSLHDISEDDRELVAVGAIFYFSIGYETSAVGQVKRSSIIKFRRLPVWTVRELAAAKRKAAEVRRAIGWGQLDEATRTG